MRATMLVSALACATACIIPPNLHQAPNAVIYTADCLCFTCSGALNPQGMCAQPGFNFPSEFTGCRQQSTKSENAFFAEATALCAAQNTSGKSDCQLQKIDPTDTQGSVFVTATQDKTCTADTNTGSSASALQTTTEDSTIAIRESVSWLEVSDQHGVLHTAVGGLISFRGANCDGVGCPLAIDKFNLTTPDKAHFIEKNGNVATIERPYVINATPVTGFAAEFIQGPPSGFRFTVPSNAMHLWASGTYKGRRDLVDATNDKNVGLGKIGHDGSFSFDGVVNTGDAKLTVHLVGQVRTWPPYVRSQKAFATKSDRVVVEIDAYTVNGQKPKVALKVDGLWYRDVALRHPFEVRDSRRDPITAIVCADGHCIERRIPVGKR